MHPLVFSCEATRLADVELTAFSQPLSSPPTHCHAAYKVQFNKYHPQLVAQAPLKHSAPGTISSALLSHAIRSAHHYSRHAQLERQAWVTVLLLQHPRHPAMLKDHSMQMTLHIRDNSLLTWLVLKGQFLCGKEFYPTNLVVRQVRLSW